MAALPVLSALGTPALSRRTSKEVALIQANQSLAAAREAARVETIAEVTQVALSAASRVSTVEALLVSRTPHAELRLRHIADAGVASMAAVVMGVERRT
jgi:hypothetical protein